MKTIQTLTSDECEKLLYCLLWKGRALKILRKGHRDYTMALLMLDAGLRVGEVVRLLVTDLILADRPVSTLYLSSEIARKGAIRHVPLRERIQEPLIQMNEIWWKQQDLNFHHFAFFSPNKKGHLSVRQVERIIKRAAMVSLGRPVHPHVLRHTFATNLMRVTSTRVVQELLGHKKLSSTQIYTHPNSQDLTDAIEKLK